MRHNICKIRGNQDSVNGIANKVSRYFPLGTYEWSISVDVANEVFDYYLIPIKIRAPLNFALLIFVHPRILRPFDFCARLFYCKFAVFHSVVAFCLLPLIFAHSYCANSLPLIFTQARCGIRYTRSQNKE